MEAPGQTSVVEYPTQKIKDDKKYVEVVEAPGQLPSLPSPKSDPDRMQSRRSTNEPRPALYCLHSREYLKSVDN